MSESHALPPFPLHDHHSHVSLYAALEGLPNLTSFSATEGQAALAFLRGQARDRLGLIVGWRSDRLALDRFALRDMPPLLIVNASLHGFVATPAALPALAALWPELAENAADPSWGERNLGRLFAFYARLAGQTGAKLDAFMTNMEALGIHVLEDMSVAGSEALELIADSRFHDRVISWATPELYRSLQPRLRERCEGVKLFLDGSLGARSAALGEAFPDGTVGRLNYRAEQLESLLREFGPQSLSPLSLGHRTPRIAVHAIGRAAIEQLVGCLEHIDPRPSAWTCLRIEHAQFIDRGQARRCKQLGLTLSMQPNFNSDSRDYTDRLSPRLCAENDPFRMLIDEAGFVPGSDLVFGSDGMPHGWDCALRCGSEPPYPGQRLTVDELAAGYRAL